MKPTDWIPGDVKPVRVGVYQREYPSGAWRYCLWNGRGWCVYGLTPKDAAEWSDVESNEQNLPWRGLAEKPE